MAPSDPPLATTSRRRSPGRFLLVALLAFAVLVVGWGVAVVLTLDQHFGRGYDASRLDRLEAGFARDPAAFTVAADRMRQFVAANPDATRIGWSRMLLCVRAAPGQASVCSPTSAADQQVFAALPAADAVVHQAKDEGRVFFAFMGNDPPRYTIMYAPQDGDPEAYADDRGFRGTRALAAGWTLLGPIPDLDRENAQFPT